MWTWEKSLNMWAKLFLADSLMYMGLGNFFVGCLFVNMKTLTITYAKTLTNVDTREKFEDVSKTFSGWLVNIYMGLCNLLVGCLVVIMKIYTTINVYENLNKCGREWKVQVHEQNFFRLTRWWLVLILRYLILLRPEHGDPGDDRGEAVEGCGGGDGEALQMHHPHRTAGVPHHHVLWHTERQTR